MAVHLRASKSISLNIISANLRLGKNINAIEPGEKLQPLKVKEMDFPFQNLFLEEMLFCFSCTGIFISLPEGFVHY